MKFESMGCLKAQYTKVEDVAQTELEWKHLAGRNVVWYTAASQYPEQGLPHGRRLARNA